MLGVEIENEDAPYKGQMWVPYINDQKHNWDTIVEENRHVSFKDDIVWKYQEYKVENNVERDNNEL